MALMRALSFTALLLSLSLAGCAGAPVSTAPKPDTPPNQAAPAEAIPPLERAVLPQVDDIREACRELLAY